MHVVAARSAPVAEPAAQTKHLSSSATGAYLPYSQYSQDDALRTYWPLPQLSHESLAMREIKREQGDVRAVD